MKEKNRILNLSSWLSIFLIVIFGFLIIMGCDGGGGGGNGDDGGADDTQAPSVPSNLVATAVSLNTINLSWDASTDDVGVVSYSIFRGNIFIKSVSSTSMSDTGLNASTNYCYSVSAIDAANNASAKSIQACVSTPASILAPSDLTATATSSVSISLSWTDNSDNEDGFIIEGSASSTFDTLQSAYLLSPNTENFIDSGLLPSTTYYYRVSAYNASGDSDYSNEDSSTTEVGSGSPLPAPSDVSATATSSSSISLAWSDNSEDEDGFRIERNITSTFDALQTTFLVGPDSTDYTDLDLESSTTYYYRVRAYNVGGSSEYSNVDEAETDAAPCALEVTAWQPQGSIESTRPLISATFRSACGAYIDVSSIEMALDGNPVTPTITGSGSEVNVTFTPNEELQNSKNYDVTVRAEDVNGVIGEKTWGFYTAFFY